MNEPILPNEKENQIIVDISELSEPNANQNEVTEKPSSTGGTSNSSSLLPFLDNLDKTISEPIYVLETNMYVEWLIFIFARIFNPDIITISFLVVFIYNAIRYKNYTIIIKPLIHVIVTLLTTLLTKHIFARKRPTIREGIRRRHNCRNKETNYSMPSGDSMQAATFGVVCYYYCNSILGYMLIPFVMFARIFYYCHYFFDTVIGALTGITVSVILYYIIRNI